MLDSKYLQASDKTGEAVLAHVTDDRSIGATTLEVDSLDNWPDEFICTVGTLLPSGLLDPDTKTQFAGHKDGANIEIDEFDPGYSDVGNEAGQVAIIKQTTSWADAVRDNIEFEKELARTGWINPLAAGDSWAYSSWDNDYKIGVITVPSDATTVFSKGMKIRISQATGGTKYGFIVDLTATTLTVYFGTDYTLNNQAISSPVYSIHRAPFGFPLDPTKWTQSITVTSGIAGVATQGVYINPNSNQIKVPIGAWELKWQGSFQVDSDAATLAFVRGGLSTDNDSASDEELIAGGVIRTSSTSGSLLFFSRAKHIVITSNTIYYLIVTTEALSGVISAGPMSVADETGLFTVKAVCAYL